MVTLARVRLVLARHPVLHWLIVGLLASAAAATAMGARGGTECPVEAPATGPADPAVLRTGELAVALAALPGLATGDDVRVFVRGAMLADGRVVARHGADVLVALPERHAGAASVAAAEGSATLALVGRD